MSEVTEVVFRFEADRKEALTGALYFHEIYTFQEGFPALTGPTGSAPNAVIDEETAVTCWLPSRAAAESLLESLQQYYAENGLEWTIQCTITEQGDRNWQDAWKEFAKPVFAGDDILVLPSHLAASSVNEIAGSSARAIRLQIDPQQAFGSGSHETTRLCLAEIERELKLRPGSSFLDVGTGSGILAIAAAKLGAGAVAGIDISPDAVECARANAELNQVRGCRFSTGDLAGLSEKFDLVCANILSGTLVEIWSSLEERTSPGGTIIASGILGGEAAEFSRRIGRSPVRSSESGEWTALVFKKEGVSA